VIAAVADTHAALWHLFDDPRLSGAARDFIHQAATVRRRIVVSSVSLAEVVYLVEKGRLPAPAYDDLRSALSDPDHVLKEAPFTIEIVDAMRKIPRVAVPDMPDRIVAATGLYFGVPVISRDRRIQSSAVQTIW
jgi:PIN domain nuclease of toxin-antitoxin system